MTLCDTSPLIALLNKRDRNHRRCVEVIATKDFYIYRLPGNQAFDVVPRLT